MYTDFSVEIITNQKVKELRQEADMSRLLHQAEEGKQERLSTGRFLSWIFRKRGIQQDNRQVRRIGTSTMASSRQA